MKFILFISGWRAKDSKKTEYCCIHDSSFNVSFNFVLLTLTLQ